MAYHGMPYQSSVPILESNDDALLSGHPALTTAHNYQPSSNLPSLESSTHNNYFG